MYLNKVFHYDGFEYILISRYVYMSLELNKRMYQTTISSTYPVILLIIPFQGSPWHSNWFYVYALNKFIQILKCTSFWVTICKVNIYVHRIQSLNEKGMNQFPWIDPNWELTNNREELSEALWNNWNKWKLGHVL